MIQFIKFEEAFESLFQQFQECVCFLYGFQEKSNNKAWYNLFEKIQNVTKCPDLAQCWANTVAYNWRNSLSKTMDVTEYHIILIDDE